ncbi:MAG: tRNA (guanosine(46)-N7)-methyltransferase TrmB [Lachnospiraceae bacterium]|nr:tRNA (guanosine(46)-N7)-methyltransferase TrmB [Lachnospiraceae bacterium]
MRLKHVKGSNEKIASDPHTIQTDMTDGEKLKDRWNEVFANDHDLYLEIGMGKGSFIIEHAEKHPERNYIGIEKFSSVLVRAIEKVGELEGRADGAAVSGKFGALDTPAAESTKVPYNKNLIFMRMDAEDILKYFGREKVKGIFLNFSDPWPKKRHAKRRLTSSEFLARYKEILAPGGIIEFKTDNSDLFEFSVKEAERSGWKLISVTRDLYGDGDIPDEIKTEYERKFMNLGSHINKMIIQRP